MLLEILIPFILIIGTLSNLVNFYVFTRPTLKGLSTFRFLSYLSLVDFFYLIVGSPHILANVYFEYDFRDYSNLSCSLHSFFTYYLSHLSSNILAAVGVFRCVTLTNLTPMKPNTFNLNTKRHSNNKCLNETSQFKRKFSAPQSSVDVIEIKRSRKSFIKRFISDFGSADMIVLAIMFIIFLFDCHFLFWMRLSKLDYSDFELSSTNSSQLSLKCYPSSSDQPIYSEFYTKAYHWIDLFLYSYIPFTIMVICTILIIYRLFQLNKRLKLSSTRQCKEIPVLKNDEALFQKLDESKCDLKTESNSKECHNNKATQYKQIKKSSKVNDLAKKRTKKNNQIYKLLLTLNIFFFVLVTPLVLSNSLGFLDYIKETHQSIFEIVYILAYLNHSMNFLFYVLSCEIYRSILIDLFKQYF
ncbi:unnamed protein product [Brachionus calyciflorus]|uniref:G-protein coupled receptors family 1 profile domain-containing protein n=1 Tax=Brachionus calyciflorus TaxID=104777 RepID=A0A814JUI7_9BILA|nr:unnamed protein product [Brachionus calyciflorus]